MSETFRPQQWGPNVPYFGQVGHADTGWLALLLIKAGNVKTNQGPTTSHKRVWICNKQIHVRKQISIRCNRIEHWVHLRCAGICQAQYTYTWTCHLHRQSRLTYHKDKTPPSRPLSKHPTHLQHPHHHNQNTRPTLHSPCCHRVWKSPNPILSSTHPLLHNSPHP